MTTADEPSRFTTDVTKYSREFCRARVRDMLRIRRLEERCAELYGAGKIRGFLHLYIGEEAVAAGAKFLPQSAESAPLITLTPTARW